MTMDYGYVTVHVTTDAAQGEVLAELLRQEGIAARFRGPATTLVGVAEHIVEMAVEVPAESEARRPASSCAIWKTRPSPPTDRPRTRRRDGRRRLHDDLPDDRRRPGRTGGGDAAGRRDRRALPLRQQRADRDARRLDRDGADRSGRIGGARRASCSPTWNTSAPPRPCDQRTRTTCRTSRDVAEPAAASRWRALARAGFTLFLPGTCHLYAGRPWTAVVLGARGVVVHLRRDRRGPWQRPASTRPSPRSA